MLGIPVRHLVAHPRDAIPLVAHPRETWTRLYEAYVAGREQRRPRHLYQPDPDWDAALHRSLGVTWPCPIRDEFERLWVAVMRELEARGIQPGPESFRDWNDGDAGFVRAIWCAIRHRALRTVVETGVAHGVTSRFILEALEQNGGGHLWSIDLPPLESEWRAQVAVAVDGKFADRWSYIEGTTRRQLPALLERVGAIDLFVHDSLHTQRNVWFELDSAWSLLASGGLVIVDDIDANNAFHLFTTDRAPLRSFICEAEPLRPDTRRFNQKGLFGIIIRDQ